MLLCLREEDQKRVCQIPWFCRNCETAYMTWADRPGDELREDPEAWRFLGGRGHFEERPAPKKFLP
jgi:hypothetical protein